MNTNKTKTFEFSVPESLDHVLNSMTEDISEISLDKELGKYAYKKVYVETIHNTFYAIIKDYDEKGFIWIVWSLSGKDLDLDEELYHETTFERALFSIAKYTISSAKHGSDNKYLINYELHKHRELMEKFAEEWEKACTNIEDIEYAQDETLKWWDLNHPELKADIEFHLETQRKLYRNTNFEFSKNI